MQPYKFFKLVFSHIKERENIKRVPYYLGFAKKVIDHLTSNGWTDMDIRVVIPSMASTLTSQGIPPSYQLICGILLRTSLKPNLVSVAQEMSAEHSKWLAAEIERLRNGA